MDFRRANKRMIIGETKDGDIRIFPINDIIVVENDLDFFRVFLSYGISFTYTAVDVKESQAFWKETMFDWRIRK